MIILLLVISLILMSIGWYLGNKYYIYENLGFGLGVTFKIISIFLLVCLLILILVYPYNVDKKIPMYEEENQKIEIKIKETVQAYMNYEQETYKNLVESAHLETLLVKYPELNSNELVKSEIETYKGNSNKIKQLKEKQLDKSILAFWLYFGK